MSLRIVEATEAHLVELAQRLRPLDRREVLALGFDDPLVGIKDSAARSDWVKAAVDDVGRVAAVWGVGRSPDDPTRGEPWFLSTPTLARHRRAFLRGSPGEMAALRGQFEALSGLVDGRYAAALRWVRWLGFSLEPYGEVNGAPFYRYSWQREPILTVRRVGCAEVMEHADFPELAAAYAEECRIAGLPMPDGKLEIYQMLEGGGCFQGLGAFLGERLIGFAVVIAAVTPHYGVQIAVTESLFVGKPYRKTGAGLALLRAAEDYARSVGSPGLLVSAPTGGVLARVLERKKGFRETNRAFFKEV
jgi:GNAT superfamily N-acetyltransferase